MIQLSLFPGEKTVAGYCLAPVEYSEWYCTLAIVHACTMPIALTCGDSTYFHSSCMYYGHGTCIYYGHSTCMYYGHSTCMYYSHSACIMSSRAHVSLPLRRWVWGASPPLGSRGLGGAGPPMRNDNNNSFKAPKYNSLLRHNISRNNLGGNCANLAKFRRLHFYISKIVLHMRITIPGQLKLILFHRDDCQEELGVSP